MLDVLGVALLVEHQQRGVLGERPRGDQPPRGRGLTGTGRAEQHHVLSCPQRQPRPLLVHRSHRHVGERARPWPFADQLSLRAQVQPLAVTVLSRGLPDPTPSELVVAKLLACSQVARSPSRSHDCAGHPRRHQRQQDERRVPCTQTDRASEREHAGGRRRIQIPRRQSCSPAKQPCANSASQAQEHRQGEVGDDRLRVQHHAAPLPARCQSVDASVEHASTASRWIVPISSIRIVPRSTLRPACPPSARTRSAISSSPHT